MLRSRWRPFWTCTIFLLIFISSVSAARVTLLDTTTATTELKWAYKFIPETDPWYEETYRGDSGNNNERAYVSCSVGSDGPVDNWLFTPIIKTNDAKRVHIATSFSFRVCSSYINEGTTCKETFGLYAKTVKEGEVLDVENFNSDEWKLVDKLTADMERHSKDSKVAINQEIRTEVVNGSGMIFAFRDNGACVSVLSVKVYYEVCESESINFATFPRTVTGAQAHDVIEVHGRCVNNAVAVRDGRRASAFCRADGKWQLTGDGACHCKPGYFPSSAANTCAACASYTYKPEAGDGACVACPKNSAAKVGSRTCACLPGFYRTATEPSSTNCTRPPTKPTQARASQVEQGNVLIEWDEPVETGGRETLWYRWECPMCAKSVRATPADRRLTAKQLRLRGLEPDTAYTVMIYAENEVSSLAGTQAYNLVEFRTKALASHTVSNLVVEVEQQDGITVAWQPPAVARTQDIHYEIEIHTNESTVVRTSDSPYYSALNLHPGMTYRFRVRANIDGWGQWSSPLVYDSRNPKMGNEVPTAHKDDWRSSSVGDVPAWVLGLIVLAVLVMMVFSLVIFRRRTINRKQLSDLDVLDTYKQDTMTPDYPSALRPFTAASYPPPPGPHKVSAPLIPTYGASSTPKNVHYGSRFKPYVDPTTYEDPNQALNDFAYIIDPQAVYITSVIGGGEFGDVCMGHLKRSHVGIGTYDSGKYSEKEIETVAIKTLKPGSSAKAKNDFLLEASIMGQFDHPNVIRLVGVVVDSEPVMIVTEYMSNGSLDNFLRSRDQRGEEMGIPRLLDMLRGIASGMHYLTEKGYVHRDLAARNVLVDQTLVCKIADFGLSRGVDPNAEMEYTTNGGKIPVRWTAPEAITHRKFTASSDVWSFGVLMWEVMSLGERPYWEWTNQKVISEIMSGFRLPAPMNTPPSIHRMMLWCWKLERHERPSFQQLYTVLDKYSRNPELVYAETGPRPAVSMHNMSGGHVGVYGSVGGSSGSRTPPPPPLVPPIYPPLSEFLRNIGLLNCHEKLANAGVDTLDDLSRMHRLDYLANGLIDDEYMRIRDALAGLVQVRYHSAGVPSTHASRSKLAGTSSYSSAEAATHTLPHHKAAPIRSTMVRPSHDNGFFV